MEQELIHRLKIATLVFKGTSDDLLFWVLIDTLFLTVVKGFTVAEVSLVFTVSFWVVLLFKRFAYESIKRMRVGKSLVCSAVLSFAFNPIALEARVGAVERIGLYYRRFGFVERRPYTFEGVYRSFCNGEPSAVLALHNGGYRWFPVLYADEEDGVTTGFEKGPLFLNDFEDIVEQCVFTLRPRRTQRARSRAEGGLAQ